MKKICIVAWILTLFISAGAQNTESISLDKAIEIALQNNLDIRISKNTYQKSKNDIFSAKSIYDNRLALNYSHTDSSSPTTSLIASSYSVSDRMTVSSTQLFSYGSELTFALNANKTSSQYRIINPEYYSNIYFRVDQPLWNGFGKKNVEYQINVNKKYSEKSFEQLKDTIHSLISDTEYAYLDLMYSIRNLKVAEEAIALAKDQYNITKKKVDFGTLAPVELLSSEANLASAEQGLIDAENLAWAAQDKLKKILNIKKKDWTINFAPDDELSLKINEYNIDQCVSEAMKKNPTVIQRRLDLQVSEMTLSNRKNSMKPKIDLYGELYYSGNNAKTITIIDETGNPQDVVVGGSIGDAFSMASDRDHETWAVGINVSYPLQNRASKAAYMNAKLDKTSYELALENSIYDVTIQVRDAIRNLEAGKRSIEAAEKTKELREKNLEIEKKKFINGMSTSFQVSEREKELAEAKVSELNSLIIYQKAEVSLKKAMGTLLDDKNFSLENSDQ